MIKFLKVILHHSTICDISKENQKINEYKKTTAKPSLKRPHRYKVLMLNDDFTPMDFVVYILEMIFNQSKESAITIMLNIHNTGLGVCGIFTYEIAETKVKTVMDLAKKHQYPLQCILEKE